MQLLGIRSRIEHPEFGKGVVTNVTSKHYWITFIDKGLGAIDLDDTFEIIEAVTDDVDSVSFSDVELSLISILKRWSDTGKVTAIASKWKGGSLLPGPNDPNLSNKEIQIDSFFIKLSWFVTGFASWKKKSRPVKTLMIRKK